MVHLIPPWTSLCLFPFYLVIVFIYLFMQFLDQMGEKNYSTFGVCVFAMFYFFESWVECRSRSIGLGLHPKPPSLIKGLDQSVTVLFGLSHAHPYFYSQIHFLCCHVWMLHAQIHACMFRSSFLYLYHTSHALCFRLVCVCLHMCLFHHVWLHHSLLLVVWM